MSTQKSGNLIPVSYTSGELLRIPYSHLVLTDSTHYRAPGGHTSDPTAFANCLRCILREPKHVDRS